MPRSYLFTCLAHGEGYMEKALRLGRSIHEHTRARLCVLTDRPDWFEGKASPNVLTQFFEPASFTNPRTGRFDFSLKRFALRRALQEPEDVVIYVDADCFLVDWDEDAMQSVIDGSVDIVTQGIRGHIRDGHFDYCRQILPLLESRPEWYERARLPYEQFLILVNRGAAARRFLDTWDWVDEYARRNGLHSDPDAVEIGIALVESGGSYREFRRDERIGDCFHFATRTGEEYNLFHDRVA